MSAAIDAKSAKARATIAIRMMRTQRTRGRSFDDCFEMGDGTEVVREIRKRAAIDKAIAEAVHRTGHGYWLEPDYLKSFDEEPAHAK